MADEKVLRKFQPMQICRSDVGTTSDSREGLWRLHPLPWELGLCGECSRSLSVPRGVKWVSAEESFVLGRTVAPSPGCCRAQPGVGEAPRLAVGRSSLAFWRSIIPASHLEPTPGGTGPSLSRSLQITDSTACFIIKIL